MFTGLIADRGHVQAVRATDQGAVLVVDTPLADALRGGDSIAVSGVCLTARDPSPERFSADVMHETLRRTGLGRLASGSVVNLELALRAQDRLGGHIVQGHVDGVGTVAAVRGEGLARVLSVEAPAELLRYVVSQGSIAVDGVSLTVSALDEGGFEVSLIPETCTRTTLGDLVPGNAVNLEVDVLAKYLEKLASAVRA